MVLRKTILSFIFICSFILLNCSTVSNVIVKICKIDKDIYPLMVELESKLKKVKVNTNEIIISYPNIYTKKMMKPNQLIN